jgi:hypothetical protein
MIVGSSYDNPNLPAEAVDDFSDTLSEEAKQCRIYGIPLALSGLVYKEFSPGGNVYRGTPPGWDNPMSPPMNYTIRLAIDPHPQVPHAVLFAATSPEGQTYFFAEIFRKLTAVQLCEAIHDIVGPRYVHISLCDPAAYIPSNIDQSVMADVLIENGVFVEKASKDLSRGIISTQAALGEIVVSPLGNTARKLMFGEHLRETLWEFDHYMWNPQRPNKPVDKNDHMMENLYRLVLEGLDYVPPDNDEEIRYIPSMIPRQNHFTVPSYGR